MQWSCPHCGVNLAIADSKLGAGWSFSKCYKCAGFALVRKSDVNLVKVDKAPAGESVILPESAETPVLSQLATQNLARYIDKPVIRPAGPRTTRTRAQSRGSLPPATVDLSRFGGNTIPTEAVPAAYRLPDPLPPDPEPTLKASRAGFVEKFLPYAIGGTAAITVCSGAYIYLEGQALWQKARNHELSSPKHVAAAPRAESTSDWVNAPPLMANTEVAQMQPIARIQTLSQSPPMAQAQVQVRAPALPPRPRTDLTDQLHANSMAPARTLPEVTSPPPLIVEVLVDQSKIHAGPSTRYPVVGFANPGFTYKVIGWKDRWFKIIAQDPRYRASAVGTVGKQFGQQIGQQIGWIRNDLVRRIN